jgi:hypothetical protein
MLFWEISKKYFCIRKCIEVLFYLSSVRDEVSFIFFQENKDECQLILVLRNYRKYLWLMPQNFQNQVKPQNLPLHIYYKVYITNYNVSIVCLEPKKHLILWPW